MHPKKLEMDEAQDYPEPGWVELKETLKFGDEGSSWRSHGVTRGVRDYFYKLTTNDQNDWKVHRITAMHRPDWTPEERKEKSDFYGGRNAPDYRRNILGLHGDATNPLFVLTRLMACVDSNENSVYNQQYHEVRISEEKLVQTGLPITELLQFPASHLAYDGFWVGMDVGMTNHPSEILVFAEEHQTRTGGKKSSTDNPGSKLKLIARVHLERISSANQRRVMEAIYEFYRPKVIAMDRTGLGLPIYQEIKEGDNRAFAASVRGYNFSEKVVIGYEPELNDEGDPVELKANVLEYSSDYLRSLVDQERIGLPWDTELLREFQGQTYVVKHSTTNPYGKKEFSQGSFHCLDAVRMAVLAYGIHDVEKMSALETMEPVTDIFLAF